MNTIQIPKSWYMNEENEIKWKYAWFSLQVFLTETDWKLLNSQFVQK